MGILSLVLLTGCGILSSRHGFSLDSPTRDIRKYNSSGGYLDLSLGRIGAKNSAEFEKGDIRIHFFADDFRHRDLAMGLFQFTFVPLLNDKVGISLSSISVRNGSKSDTIELMDVIGTHGGWSDTLLINRGTYPEWHGRKGLGNELTRGPIRIPPDSTYWIQTDERNSLDLRIKARDTLEFRFRRHHRIKWYLLTV